MGKHALYSPSKMGTLRLCPGYVNHNKDRPEQRNDAAVDGTHTHTLLEICLTAESWDAFDYLNQQMEDHDGSFVADKDRCTRVNVALSYIKSRVTPYKPADFDIYAEVQVRPDQLIGRDDWHGTSDVVITTPDFIEIVDYKDGRQPVSAEANDQLISYGLGYLGHIPIDSYPPMVRLTIIQPKVSSQPEFVEIPTAELLQKLPEYKAIIEDAEDPDAPRVPGEKQCMFCLGRLDCPERKEVALQAAETAFAGIELPAPQAPLLRDVSGELSNENLGKILDAAPLVNEWLKEMEAEALRRFKTGQLIPNHKVVHATTRRHWLKDEDLVVKKLKGKRLNDKDIYEKRLKGFTKILNNTKLNAKQREDIETKLIVKPEGGLSVVSESDKRKAVLFDATSMFENAPTPEQLTKSEPQPEPAPAPISFL